MKSLTDRHPLPDPSAAQRPGRPGAGDDLRVLGDAQDQVHVLLHRADRAGRRLQDHPRDRRGHGEWGCGITK